MDLGGLVGEETGVPGEKPPTSEREGLLTLLLTCDPNGVDMIVRTECSRHPATPTPLNSVKQG